MNQSITVNENLLVRQNKKLTTLKITTLHINTSIGTKKK
jgi:hypothetical protein